MRTMKYILPAILLFAAGMMTPSCSKKDTAANYNADKSKLAALIDSINQVYNKAAEGAKPGNYAVGTKTTLKTAIDLAVQVNTGSTFTQQEVDNTIANLKKAAQQFNASLIQEVSVANLVAFWKFNGNAVDSSGHNHNGIAQTGWVGNSFATATDGKTLPQSVPDRFNRPGMAYDFSNGAHVEVPYDASLNPKSFTISLWLKRHTTNSNNYILSLNRWNGFKLQLQSNNFLFLTFRADNGFHDVDDNPGTIPQDIWTYAAVSYADGAMKFYINNALVKTVTVTGTPVTLSPPVNLAIANQLPKSVYSITDPASPFAYGGENFFIGSLDDIRFYNTALSDAEILSIYTIEKTL